jgi:arylformamidase
MRRKKGFIDISMPIQEDMVVFPGDPGFRRVPILSQAKGDLANVYTYEMSSHTGTHIDFPRHFISNGRSLKDIPLERFIGNAHVLDVSHANHLIMIKDLRNLPEPVLPKILLKTINSKKGYLKEKRFFKNYVALGLEAAKYLVKRGVQTIGIDYLSIDEYNTKDHAVHKFLLGHGISIIEGLDLRKVLPGKYFFICLPLNIPSAEGSPARVILMEAV